MADSDDCHSQRAVLRGGSGLSVATATFHGGRRFPRNIRALELSGAETDRLDWAGRGGAGAGFKNLWLTMDGRRWLAVGGRRE